MLAEVDDQFLRGGEEHGLRVAVGGLSLLSLADAYERERQRLDGF